MSANRCPSPDLKVLASGIFRVQRLQASICSSFEALTDEIYWFAKHVSMTDECVFNVGPSGYIFWNISFLPSTQEWHQLEKVSVLDWLRPTWLYEPSQAAFGRGPEPHRLVQGPISLERGQQWGGCDSCMQRIADSDETSQNRVSGGGETLHNKGLAFSFLDFAFGARGLCLSQLSSSKPAQHLAEEFLIYQAKLGTQYCFLTCTTRRPFAQMDMQCSGNWVGDIEPVLGEDIQSKIADCRSVLQNAGHTVPSPYWQPAKVWLNQGGMRPATMRKTWRLGAWRARNFSFKDSDMMESMPWLYICAECHACQWLCGMTTHLHHVAAV